MQKRKVKVKIKKRRDPIPWWILGGFIVLFMLAGVAHRSAREVKGAATVNTSLLSKISALLFTHSVSPTPSQSLPKASSTISLGDNKAVYDSPKKGYIYLCHTLQEGGGAFQDGPWIQGTSWDPTKKVTVDGAVSWKNAKASVIVQGSSRIISTNDLPTKHTTGVFPIQSTDDAYQYDRNPNSIKEQSLRVTLPKDPTAASTPNCIGGEVGIALTGVAIFDGFDAEMRDAVAHEVQDNFGGHPQISGEYHYHNIPKLVEALLPASNGMTLVGYAYDGYGIYSSVENGKKLTNADLDECHGHSHQIVWDGKKVTMYHYHATDEFPYTVSCFHGTSAFKGPTGGQGMSGQSSAQRGMMQARPSMRPMPNNGFVPPPGMPLERP